ncbi:MAG: hypothetical protein ACN6O3_21200 [Comamonas sp.]
MATAPQIPSLVPPMRPAPTPIMTRPQFIPAAFNFCADMDPFRQAMNVLATATYNNAYSAYQSNGEAATSAAQAGGYAVAAEAAKTSAQQMLASMQAIKDAVDAGGVYQVNGKQGIITLRDFDMWVYEHSNVGSNGTVLNPNTSYSLYTVAAYSRPLPDRPPIGSKIRLCNMWGTWANSLFTLTRPRATVKINNVGEDVLFNNGRIPYVILEYIWEDTWVMG